MEERFRNLDYQNWKPVRTLGSGSYGTVYEIARDDGFGMVDHAALKVLSPPHRRTLTPSSPRAAHRRK